MNWCYSICPSKGKNMLVFDDLAVVVAFEASEEVVVDKMVTLRWLLSNCAAYYPY